MTEEGVPEWLWRSVPDEEGLAALPEANRFGGETNSRQVFHRLAGCWTYWGWKGGYFSSEDDARTFYDEMCFMLASADGRAQLAAVVQHRPSLGLRHRRPAARATTTSTTATASCTILDLRLRAASAPCLLHPVRHRRPGKPGRHHGPVGARGAHLQIRLGHRLQLLRLRGENEPLSGGGKSTGLMSFLKIGDRAAGAIKSGGTTRRAAKMVIVDIDHPDIEKFIDWKVVEEQKVAALVAGSICAASTSTPSWRPGTTADEAGDDACDPKRNPKLRARSSPHAGVSRRPASLRGIEFAEQGDKTFDFPVYDTDWEAKPTSPSPARTPTTPCACPTPSSRPSEADKNWDLTDRVDRQGAKTLSARDLWDRIGKPPGPAPTPACSTTPPSTSGTPAPTRRINGSNPAPSTCSWTTPPATSRR